MADTKGPCEECGKVRSLQRWNINQMATRMMCAKCIDEDSRKRSEAATGKAGRKPKSESQLEDQLFRVFLTSADAKTLEAWLASEGFTGSRGQMLKGWALRTIERARKRS